MFTLAALLGLRQPTERPLLRQLRKETQKTLDLAMRTGEVRSIPGFLDEAGDILNCCKQVGDETIIALLEKMEMYADYMRHPDYFRSYLEPT